MNIIKTFDFDEKKLTVYGTIDKPLFKAKEVATVLDYKDTDKAIRVHVSEEDKKRATRQNGGLQEIYINESGLYTLIFGSKKQEAKKFKHFVTSEILPTIRRTGTYQMPTYRISDDKRITLNNEADLQKEIVKFLREYKEKYNLKIVVPLGELQDTQDKRLTSYKMGYEKGQPDIILNNSSIHHEGLIIELKTPNGNGVLSDSQKKIIKSYKEDGYKIIVSNDLKHIIHKLTLYFTHLRLKCRYCCNKFKTAETRKSHIENFHKKCV